MVNANVQMQSDAFIAEIEMAVCEWEEKNSDAPNVHSGTTISWYEPCRKKQNQT